jgi:hypothetical protein
MKTKTTAHRIYCYDRYALHKRGLALLASTALVGLLGWGLASQAQVAPEVQQLPRVVISGKSQATLAAEAAGVQRLPRVLIEGRSLEGQRLAASN